MIPGLNIPTQRPSSAEEAVLFANQTLHSAGLYSAKVSLLEPATGADGFSGAVVEATLPESELVTLFAKVAAAKATEQGGKVSDCTLKLESNTAGSVQITCSMVAKMMMASLQLQLSGEIYQVDSKHFGVRQLRFDPGSGMFASMASAMIRPRLNELEGRTFNLDELLGFPVEIRSMRVENQCLKIELSA
ncbi:MAG: hypothetical protein WCO60_01800 [Verrucomicrobiota bacterium]